MHPLDLVVNDEHEEEKDEDIDEGVGVQVPEGESQDVCRLWGPLFRIRIAWDESLPPFILGLQLPMPVDVLLGLDAEAEGEAEDEEEKTDWDYWVREP